MCLNKLLYSSTTLQYLLWSTRQHNLPTNSRVRHLFSFCGVFPVKAPLLDYLQWLHRTLKPNVCQLLRSLSFRFRAMGDRHQCWSVFLNVRLRLPAWEQPKLSMDVAETNRLRHRGGGWGLSYTWPYKVNMTLYPSLLFSVSYPSVQSSPVRWSSSSGRLHSKRAAGT